MSIRENGGLVKSQQQIGEEFNSDYTMQSNSLYLTT